MSQMASYSKYIQSTGYLYSELLAYKIISVADTEPYYLYYTSERIQ